MMIDDSAFGPWTNLIVLNGGMIASGGNHGVAYKHNFEIGPAGGTFFLGSGWESLLIGNVSGTGQVVFASTGQENTDRDWYVSGTNNSYSGGTIIANSGKYHGVTVAAASSLGTGDVYVQTNGGLRLNGNANIGSADGITVSRQAALTVDGTAKFRSSAPSIGSLAGGLGSVILGSDGTTEIASQPPAPAGPTVLTVGGDGSSTTFYGVISEVNGTTAQGSLTKIGTGKLSLWGVNTYTGATAVNNGTLAVNGSLASTTVTVGDLAAPTVTATLAGNGIIAGAVTVNANGIVAPGSSIGTLTVGTMTFANVAVLNYDFGTAGTSHTTPGSSDLIAVTSSAAGALAFPIGGWVTLNMASGLIPTTGSGSFELFSYGSGSASTVSNFTGGNGASGSIVLNNFTVGPTYTIVNDTSNKGIFLDYSNVVVPGSGTWMNTSGDYKWTTTGNWATGYPAAPGQVATFGNAGLAATVTPVILDTAIAVGGVELNTTIGGYTLGLASSPVLTLDNTGGGGWTALVHAVSGTHTIAAKVATTSLGTDLEVTVDAGTILHMTGGIDNSAAKAVTLTVAALGTLTTGNIDNAGTLAVNGTVSVGAVSGAGSASVDGSLTADSIAQATLTIAAGATVSIRPTLAGPGGANASQVPEPAMWLLLAAGAACLLPLVRRAWQRRI